MQCQLEPASLKIFLTHLR